VGQQIMIVLQASPVSQDKNVMIKKILGNLSPKGNKVVIIYLFIFTDIGQYEGPQPIRLVFY